MAVNVTLKRKQGGSWVEMHPETILDQISDLSALGRAILDITPEAGVRFVQVNASGSPEEVTLLDATALKAALDAADLVHTHTSDEIFQGGTSLTDVLDAKADLSGGYILASQIPDYLFGGLRFVNTLTTDVAVESLVLEGNSDAERVGSFFAATNTVVLSTSAGHTMQAPGDEGDYIFPVTIEAGDWLVYLGSNNWAVVNNTYAVATSSSQGVVRLSTGTATTRSSLSASTSGLDVMDEKAVRNVMKDVHYASAEPTGLEGDLLFQGSF